MRVFLSGQKYFGQEALRLLLAMGINVVGVAAPPGNGRDGPDRLWKLASSQGINLTPAGNLNADTLPVGVDLIVCAHSHDFIGKKTRQKTKLGAVGFHPSLLPLHRGRDAIYWAVKMGDRVTGGSVFWLNDTVDGGPIAAQDWCFIPPGAAPLSLWLRELQPMGLRLFALVLSDLRSGTIVALPQEEALATWEPSVGRPPLYRPDLEMIGSPPPGFEVIRRKAAAQAAPQTRNPWVEAYAPELYDKD